MAERKGKKLRRCTAASKGYYKAQFDRTDQNRMKRWGRHLRHFPEDTLSAMMYDERYIIGAEGHQNNMTAKAARRKLRARGVIDGAVRKRKATHGKAVARGVGEARA
jgi:hypothetical protein